MRVNALWVALFPEYSTWNCSSLFVNLAMEHSGRLRSMVLAHKEKVFLLFPLSSHLVAGEWKGGESVFCQWSWLQTPLEAVRIRSEAVKRGGRHRSSNVRKRKTSAGAWGTDCRRTWNALGSSRIYKWWASWDSWEIFCGPTFQWNALLSLKTCEELAADWQWLVLNVSLGSSQFTFPGPSDTQMTQQLQAQGSHGEVCHRRHHTPTSHILVSKAKS